MRFAWFGLYALACACSADPIGHGVFTPASDDETIDATDPPTDPDPIEVMNSTKRCDKPDSLSPVGLTFVLHVSKDAGIAAREVKHLGDVRHYIRPRDVFMLEHGSPAVADVRAIFPCNRIHIIAFPDDMSAALATGNGIDGIAVDWEGANVDAHSLAWSEDRLHEYAKSIHGDGKRAAFVPAWSWQSSDAAAASASNMDYALAQIQGSCVNGADTFGSYAHALANDFHERGNLRNVGFEISMDSFDAASNHVSADRAAACTRNAYGKGARAIYIYGNGHDQLPSYFQSLHAMGIRAPL